MSNSQISIFNFKSQPVRIQSFNDEPYFCLSDVCIVLGVNRRSSEAFRLNEKGCKKIATLTNGGEQEIIFINEPNLYRIIFRSNKANAVEFQNWVFEEVLPQIRKTGKYQLEPKQLALPEPEKKYPFELTEHELQTMAWLWFIALRGAETCRMIYPAMEKLGSKYSGAIYGQAYEYNHNIREGYKLLRRLTAGFQYDYESNWRVIKHLNNYNPKSNNYHVI